MDMLQVTTWNVRGFWEKEAKLEKLFEEKQIRVKITAIMLNLGKHLRPQMT